MVVFADMLWKKDQMRLFMQTVSFLRPRRGAAVFGGVSLALAGAASGLRLARPDSHAPVPVTAVVNVAVIPMDREQVLGGQTVLVRGDRIVAIGPVDQVQVPPEAVRVDGAGKFLMPGLADMHVHIPGPRVMLSAVSLDDSAAMAEAENILFLLLANGVTTVRLMWGFPAQLALREQAAKGALLSPRIYAASAPISGALPEEAVNEMVAEAKAEGYDFIKVRDGGSPAIAAAAHKAGLPLVGHANYGVDDLSDTTSKLEQSLKLGFASFEHLDGYIQYLTGQPHWERRDGNSWLEATQHVDESKIPTIVAATKQAGVWNCPTQMLWEIYNIDPDTLAQWPELRYVTPENRAWQAQAWTYNAHPTPEWKTDPARTARRVVEVRRKVIKALHDAGAGLLLCSDTPVPFITPGFSVHRELQALVAAGLTPYQALETGTRNIAVFLGTLDSTGTVAVGKRADLVLLSGNPLTDIRQTARPAGVMIGGRWLSRVDLDARLATLEEKLEL